MGLTCWVMTRNAPPTTSGGRACRSFSLRTIASRWAARSKKFADDSRPNHERHLCAAYRAIARMHDAPGHAYLDNGTMTFHQRPYRVLGAGRFAKAVSDEIREAQLRKIYESAGP